MTAIEAVLGNAQRASSTDYMGSHTLNTNSCIETESAMQRRQKVTTRKFCCKGSQCLFGVMVSRLKVCLALAKIPSVSRSNAQHPFVESSVTLVVRLLEADSVRSAGNVSLRHDERFPHRFPGDAS